MRVETVIIAIAVASMAAILLGTYGVLREWARAADPPPPPYRGHHQKPAGPSRLRVFADGVLETVGELAAARALMTGVTDAYSTP